MNARTLIAALGLTVAIGTPVAAHADITWETTYDEPGSRIVLTKSAAPARNAPAADFVATRPGDISADRQYEFLGDEGGWQLRTMQYRFEGGRLVHVDDPVGHMLHQADATPLNELQRTALERSAGG